MNDKIERKFNIGSNWVYFKIYGSPFYLEFFLIDYILKMINQLEKKEMINSFFYVNYNDPDFHLRLRFNVSKNIYIYDIIKMLNTILERKEVGDNITDFIMSSYKREIERYGDKSIYFVELFYYYDSIIILNYLKFKNDNLSFQERKWILALELINQYFDIFNLNLNNRIDLLSNCRDSFKKEFGINDSNYTKKLLKNYNENKLLIKKNLFGAKRLKNNKLNLLLEDKVKNYFSFKNSLNKNKIKVNEIDVLISIIHMGVNRIFLTESRFSEMILYEYLLKIYKEKLFSNKS